MTPDNQSTTTVPIWMGLVLFGLPLFCTMGSCESESDQEPLTIIAASSVADVIRDIAILFEKAGHPQIVISQGASGRLCKQLQFGAVCDIFIPADPIYLDRLQQQHLIFADSRSTLAGNQLVVVMAGPGHGLWSDVGRLRDASLGPIVLASIDHAPAGRYAKQTLQHAGLWNELRPRIRYADNVRLAARYVAEGGMKIGLVYSTDALAFAGKMAVVYRFIENDHRPIRYDAAICKTSWNPTEAQAFLDFARSPVAEEIWRRYGFLSFRKTSNPNPEQPEPNSDADALPSGSRIRDYFTTRCGTDVLPVNRIGC